MKAQQAVLDSFLAETLDNIDALERGLVFLEQNPEDTQHLNTAFRAVHTIKGTCGFLGLRRLEALTHAAEDLLGALRDGQLRLDLRGVNLLLEVADAVRALVRNIRDTGSDEGMAFTELRQSLEDFLVEGAANANPPSGDLPASSPDSRPPSSAMSGEVTAADTADLADHRIHVDVSLLDRLMDLVGELVLTRNRLLHSRSDTRSDTRSDRRSEERQDSGPVLQRLDTVTSELQHGLLQARMQPINALWSTYPRMLRDLEQDTGKKVELSMEGGETELDRTLLQAVRDPLKHLLRNAVDHGIELPEERLAAGKPERGQLRLRALHESGNVIVEVTDDGRGIDTDAVLQRAREVGLAGEEEAAALRASAILDFLFRPGFSTAGAVTSLSGRGVGLDVVRSDLRRIDGSIEIQTSPGEGTCFRVKVPLTLSIIPAIVVLCEGRPLAIPQSSILEILEIHDGESADNRIEYIHRRPVCRLRGELLPLVDLREMLGLGDSRKHGSGSAIAVLDADGFACGVIADAVVDTEEVVVKPLGRHFRDIRCYAGATIMGDGRLALILDGRAVAERIRGEREEQAEQEGRHDTASEADAGEDAVLLFRLPGRVRAALPLERVARLEEFPAHHLERSRGIDVMQYRDGILPLVRLDESSDARETLPTVVCRQGDRRFGIVVDQIDDIARMDRDALDRRGSSGVFAGSAVINGHVTDLLNLDEIIRSNAAPFTERAPDTMTPEASIE